jgi:hypothetical protein
MKAMTSPPMARIYQPAKTAMQSGRGQTKEWHIEFDAAQARYIEPLMGWTGSRDTLGQVNMDFPSREAAIAFARKHGFAYSLEEPHGRRPRPKAYADNFSFQRIR